MAFATIELHCLGCRQPIRRVFLSYNLVLDAASARASASAEDKVVITRESHAKEGDAGLEREVGHGERDGEECKEIFLDEKLRPFVFERGHLSQNASLKGT